MRSYIVSFRALSKGAWWSGEKIAQISVSSTSASLCPTVFKARGLGYTKQ